MSHHTIMLTEDENRRFDLLISRVSKLGGVSKLSPSEQKEYNRLADKWEDSRRKPKEKFGF